MKKLRRVLLAPAISIALFGCGGDDDSDEPGRDPNCTSLIDNCENSNFGGGGGADDSGGSMQGAGGAMQPAEDNSCTVEFTEGDLQVEDSCTGDEICSRPDNGTCASAFNRRYLLFAASANVSDRKPDGGCWDAACGAPDPFINVYVNDELVGGAPTQSDNFSPSWDMELGEATIVRGSRITIQMFDEDLSENDIILNCETVLSADLLRGRILACVAQASEDTYMVLGLAPSEGRP